ncbi:MAG: hypothetical protein MJZ33_11865 [Paludibacteraceae bacterium]|nr:hypothetical protein [Paludibacteraceae bacterium]
MKRLNLIRIVSILLFSLFLASCETNQSTIDELSSLKEEIETEGDEFDAQDWENFTNRYEALNEKMSKRKYTAEEKREIRKLRGKIAAQMTKKSFNGLKKQLEDLPNMIDDLTQSATDFLEGFADEIDK